MVERNRIAMNFRLSFLVLLAAVAPVFPACGSSTVERPPAESGLPKLGEDPELDRWIGQMLLLGFRGARLTEEDPFLEEVRRLHVGGVVLFDYDVPSRTPERNIIAPDQVRELTATLRRAAEIPLFIAIDQEGGRIARLKPERDFPPTRSQAELGRLDQEEATRENARRIASTLKDLGVNLNFAPVLDLALNPDNPVIAKLERSYGADPDKVVRHARWTIEEFHKQGVLSCVKHFPGHGSSIDDSHEGLPEVTGHWKKIELDPFQRLIREGLPDMVMTAHIYNADWDPQFPATLSPQVIQGMLRETLQFDGPVVSDDIQMGAITDQYSLKKSIELAVKAGVDIVTIGNNLRYDPEIGAKAFLVLHQLVAEGTLTRERLRESYERIQKAKNSLGAPRDTDIPARDSSGKTAPERQPADGRHDRSESLEGVNS